MFLPPAFAILFVVFYLSSTTTTTATSPATKESQGLVVHNPHRVSWSDLLDDTTQKHQVNDQFWKALETDGFVSLRNVFGKGNNDNNKNVILANLHDCASTRDIGQSHIFADGAHRRTIAGHSTCSANKTQRQHPALIVPEVEQPEDPTTTSSSSTTLYPTSCRIFESASQGFRRQVDIVAQIVAQQLDLGLADAPIRILTNTGDSFYGSIQEMVFQGEHLEHFHSYQKKKSTTDNHSGSSSNTMDWHKDQGLFLLFTPGRWISQGVLSQDLYIVQDGVTKQVQFSATEDDLVVLLGDGMTQLLDGSSSSDDTTTTSNRSSKQLVVPLHSLSIVGQDKDDEARVWYGRMVLPPADAVHLKSGLSYGDLRQELNANHAGDIGCSSSSMVARQMQASECNATELLCWHQCMILANFNVSETVCEEQKLDLACVNLKNEVWDGQHADMKAGYAPRCIDLETAVIANSNTTTTQAATNTTTTTSSTNETNGEDDDHDHSTHNHTDDEAKNVTGNNNEMSASSYLSGLMMMMMIALVGMVDMME